MELLGLFIIIVIIGTLAEGSMPEIRVKRELNLMESIGWQDHPLGQVSKPFLQPCRFSNGLFVNTLSKILNWRLSDVLPVTGSLNASFYGNIVGVRLFRQI